MKDTFLVIAYMAIWLGLSGYLATLAHRQKKLSLRIELLNKRINVEEE
jgi:CcmD family protein